MTEEEKAKAHNLTVVDMGLRCKIPYDYSLKFQSDVLKGWSTNSNRMVLDINSITDKSALHPFVLGLHIAFANENEFQITPDNIWLLIAQGVSQHINLNADKFKAELNITFDGKKTIEIIRDNFVSNVIENSWEDCFPEFAEKIENIIGTENVTMMIGDFTTTTPTDKISYQIVLMDMVKQFLDYRVATRCGVEKYYIQGTVEDWQQIFDKIQNFRKVGLDEWINKLQIFIVKLIEAISGNPDILWFQNLYKYESRSGSDCITGNILSLFPYLKDYNGQFVWNNVISTSSDKFPSGVTDVPFVWQYFESMRSMHFKTTGILSLNGRCICVNSVAQVEEDI